MAKMNVAAVINGLEKVLSAVQEIAPLAKEFGGPIVANVATIGIATMATAQNLLERGKDAKTLATSQDEAKLRAIITELQSANDKLNAAVTDT